MPRSRPQSASRISAEAPTRRFARGSVGDVSQKTTNPFSRAGTDQTTNRIDTNTETDRAPLFSASDRSSREITDLIRPRAAQPPLRLAEATTAPLVLPLAEMRNANVPVGVGVPPLNRTETFDGGHSFSAEHRLAEPPFDADRLDDLEQPPFDTPHMFEDPREAANVAGASGLAADEEVDAHLDAPIRRSLRLPRVELVIEMPAPPNDAIPERIADDSVVALLQRRPRSRVATVGKALLVRRRRSIWRTLAILMMFVLVSAGVATVIAMPELTSYFH